MYYLPTIYFYVKTTFFKILCFLEFEEDLYETSHFCYNQYGKSTVFMGPVSSFSFSIFRIILKQDITSKKGYSVLIIPKGLTMEYIKSCI